MHRRTFLLASSASLLPTMALAYSAQTFSPSVWRDLRASDQPIILNYRASWSLTCQIKAELIAEALADTPAYRNLTFIDIDWDTFGQSQLTQRLNVTRRSTLLGMKQDREVARLENAPYAHRVRAFLDAALTA